MAITLRQLTLSLLMLYSASVFTIVFIIFFEHGKYRVQIDSKARSVKGLSRNFKDEAANYKADKASALQGRTLVNFKAYKNSSAEGYESGQAEDENSQINDCPQFSPMLKGKLNVDANFVPTEAEAIRAAGVRVIDGCFEPTECNATQTLALIVPYKNRRQHLITLMHHLHPILQRQWLRYCVFVPEQYDDGAFNKARVMNAGFLEIMKHPKYKFDCLIFHDVDMLMEDDRNLYKCAEGPKHLSPALEKFNYKVNYGTDFGGVGAVSVNHYKLVNGHSNRFYGWGGEDSDIELRYKLNKLKKVWSLNEYGRYKMIPHEHPWYFNPTNGIGSHKKRRDTRRFDEESIFLSKSDPSGLSSIKYTVRDVVHRPLFTKITLDTRTFLVNSASVRFTNHEDVVQVENPWFTNQRLNTEANNKTIRGFGIEAGDEFPNYGCHYQRFEGKTVNKTLGVKINGTYSISFNNLEEAKKKCNKLVRYCNSILETSPGQYQLRSTAFMHERILTYQLGLYPQALFKEEHTEISVFAKICPNDTRYLQFISKPVLIQGKNLTKPAVTHQADFDLQMYKVENMSLYYSVKVYSAHKAIMRGLEDVLNKSLGIYDSLSLTYQNSVFILNMTNPKNMKKFLPDDVASLEDLAQSKNPVLSVRTPPMATPGIPGSYVCESVITDQNGSPHLSWKWWFEIRGGTPEIEKQILNANLKNAKVGSTEFTEGLHKNFAKVLRFPGNLEITDDIMRMIAGSIAGKTK